VFAPRAAAMSPSRLSSTLPLTCLLLACSAPSVDITDLGHLGGGKSDFLAIENLPITVVAASGNGPVRQGEHLEFPGVATHRWTLHLRSDV